jgi:hypothetical protein
VWGPVRGGPNTRHSNRGSIICREGQSIDDLARERLSRIGGSGEDTARSAAHAESTQMLGIGLGPNREHAKQPPDIVHRVGIIEAHATLDGVPDHMREEVFVADSH